MTRKKGWLWLLAGLAIGLSGGWFLFDESRPVWAGYDRHDDYVLTASPLASGLPGVPELDGIWLVDQRRGKLLASMTAASGRISGWAEVDLLSEFGIPSGHAAHFLATTGVIGGRAVLYVAETTSGRLGIYTIAVVGNNEIAVRRHDMVGFRAPPVGSEE